VFSFDRFTGDLYIGDVDKRGRINFNLLLARRSKLRLELAGGNLYA
jgi:hypothetical protein